MSLILKEIEYNCSCCQKQESGKIAFDSQKEFAGEIFPPNWLVLMSPDGDYKLTCVDCVFAGLIANL